ncbi:MAG: T9SS type B sorting domain-containing protein [Flavobacteriales bacterium]|nr:T9SS type B sorting domain-containing protein [Flavobacteriales bacterium]
MSDFVIWGDTIFDPHDGIDTELQQNSYSVEFYSGGEIASTSLPATSVFIDLIPNDNQLTVDINHTVPWDNYLYEIYLFDNDLGDYVLEGTSEEPIYVIDSLLNNVEYCVQVRTIGTFNTPDIHDPLENWSQERCGVPFDLTPPCPPELFVDADCLEIVDWLDWTNPNSFCADDVTGYNLYYTPILGGDFELIASIEEATDTSYIYNEFGESNSIAGCFYVTALDSLLMGPEGVLVQNESAPSDTICVDNCPIYFLPNVFSPNNDLVNDLFMPFPYKFVESIDLKVFNRWGEEVFATTDPDIDWNGTHTKTGQVLSDGVYYYTIQVNTIRLAGIEPERFSGEIQLINGQNPLNE